MNRRRLGEFHRAADILSDQGTDGAKEAKGAAGEQGVIAMLVYALHQEIDPGRRLDPKDRANQVNRKLAARGLIKL